MSPGRTSSREASMTVSPSAGCRLPIAAMRPSATRTSAPRNSRSALSKVRRWETSRSSSPGTGASLAKLAEPRRDAIGRLGLDAAVFPATAGAVGGFRIDYYIE